MVVRIEHIHISSMTYFCEDVVLNSGPIFSIVEEDAIVLAAATSSAA